MSRSRIAAVVSTLLVLGSAASADETGSSAGGTGAPVAQRAQDSEADAPAAPRLEPDPYRRMWASTRPLFRMGLFAEGRGFTILRQGTVFDVEGGASLRLLESLDLVGSYRLLGYDYAIGRTTFDPQMSAAFFGLKLGF